MTIDRDMKRVMEFAEEHKGKNLCIHILLKNQIVNELQYKNKSSATAYAHMLLKRASEKGGLAFAGTETCDLSPNREHAQFSYNSDPSRIVPAAKTVRVTSGEKLMRFFEEKEASREPWFCRAEIADKLGWKPTKVSVELNKLRDVVLHESGMPSKDCLYNPERNHQHYQVNLKDRAELVKLCKDTVQRLAAFKKENQDYEQAINTIMDSLWMKDDDIRELERKLSQQAAAGKNEDKKSKERIYQQHKRIEGLEARLEIFRELLEKNTDIKL